VRCCPECTGDHHLQRQIISDLSGEPGRCGYCDRTSDHLVEPSKLRDYFEPVVAIYVRAQTGLSLAECLTADWGTFPAERITSDRANRLVADILENEAIFTSRFSPLDTSNSKSLEAWRAFRDEIKGKNRYFPRAVPDLDRLRQRFWELSVGRDALAPELFRARIQRDGRPHTVETMGVPPPDRMSEGRAHPVGISCLYSASDVNTAIAELRPQPGETVSVATVSLRGDLHFVDLRDARKRLTPFSLLDGEAVSRLKEDMPFLVRLGEELAEPVRPTFKQIDYLPTQYLCEFAKYCGFHGVIYRSAIEQGANLALFDEANATIGSITSFRVRRVRLEYAKNES
jgi:hypothetical protein